MRLVDRMIRAARCDISLYEEVEADQTALPQAMATVLLSSLAAGLATVSSAGFGAPGVLLQILGGFLGWGVWAYLTYLIGTRLLPEPQTQATVGELLRTLGFANSPGVIRILGLIPGLMRLSFFVAGVWTFVTTVIAVRQALDYTSTGRAVGVCLIGFVVQVVLLAALFTLFGPPGA